MVHPLSDRVGPVSCNPIEQARMCEEKRTDLNLVIGLVWVTMPIYKTLTHICGTACSQRQGAGHNPLAAVYCSAVNKKMEKKGRGT